MRRALHVPIALLGIATVLGYLDRLSWFFELGTFFRLQYAILLLALGLLAFARRDGMAAVAAALLAALNLATVAPHFSSRSTLPVLGSGRVEIGFANVDVSNHDHRGVEAYLHALDADMVGITELSPAWRDALAGVLRHYPYRILHVENDAYGIGLYSKRPLHGSIVRFPADGPATVVARFALAGKTVTLVVTHPHTPFGPHAGGLHQQQLRALGRARADWSARALVCGDLNTPPWSGPLRSLMHTAKLADSHRGYGYESSWPTWAWPLRVPIDNCLVSPGLAVVHRERGPKLGSDHFPLVVRLAATRLSVARSRRLTRR
jgi:endonuclease/exonuclease/phosphatase (EEP) superfamily protein YafD